MRLLTSILIILLTSFVAKAQKIAALRSLILSADTILLVSHKQTDGFVIVNEKTGKESEPKKVVINGRANTAIIIKSVMLPDTARQALTQLITKHNTDKTIETCNSFIPFHAVLLIKKGKTSFVDISFSCNNLLFALNKSNSQPIYFGRENMKALEIFFKENGIMID